MKLALILVLIGFQGCSSSSQLPTLDASDYGKDNTGTNKANEFDLVRADSQVHSSYYSNGCHKIVDGSSCDAIVTYSGTRNMVGQTIGFSVSPKGSFTVKKTESCAAVSTQKQGCKITLQHNSGQPTSAIIRAYVGRPSRAIALYAPSPVNLAIGVSDILNIGAAVFGPVGADEIEKLLGLNPDKAVLTELNQISGQISALTSTVNQILNNLQKLENLDILEFSELETTIQNNNLKQQLQELNQNTLGGADIYAEFESAIVSGTCPASQAPLYNYPSESQIASTAAYLSGVYAAFGCSTTGQSTTCSNMNSALQNATDLVSGNAPFDAALFQAVNAAILANLKVQFSVAQFQSNNESLISYALLIAQTLQKSYNMIHVGLYLSQVAQSKQFPGLLYPISNPLMTPNNPYAQNKDALDTYFTDLGNQLQEALYASIMTDNPNDPSQLWTNNPSAALSPKLIATDLNAIPTNGSNWVSGCNLYEWAGALTPENYKSGTPTATCSSSGLIVSTVQNPPASLSDYIGSVSSTGLSAKCYYQGQSNSSSILFSSCAASSQNQSQINTTQTPKPYLQCSLLPDATNFSTGNIDCSSNSQNIACFQGEPPEARPPNFILINSNTFSPHFGIINGSEEYKDPFRLSGKIIPVQILLENSEIVQFAVQYWGGINPNDPLLGELQCLANSFYLQPSGCQRTSHGIQLTTISGYSTQLSIQEPWIDFSADGGLGFAISRTPIASTKCIANFQCSNPTPFCNTDTYQCVSCLVDENCPAGQGCSSGLCVALPCGGTCGAGEICCYNSCRIGHVCD